MKIRDLGSNQFIRVNKLHALELYHMLGDLDATLLKPIETQILLDFRAELLRKADDKEKKIVSSFWRFSVLKNILLEYYKDVELSTIIVNKINGLILKNS